MASQPSHPPQLLSPPQQATASLAPDVAMILDHQFHKDDDIAIDANGQPKTLEETLAELRSKLKMTKRTTPRSTPVPGGSDVPMNGVEPAVPNGGTISASSSKRVLQEDSSSDDSSSDDAVAQPLAKRAKVQVDEEGGDDSDGDVNFTAGGMRTANEIEDSNIPPPPIEVVPEDYPLAVIGTAESVIRNVLVIKPTTGAKERVLDEGTLVCLADRRALGVIFETFGAVNDPRYTVRFPSSTDPLLLAASVPTEIYHVDDPDFSAYVFTETIRALPKGSDASNLHDEEVAAHEMEYSDDEQEAAAKLAAKQARREKPTSRQASAAPGHQTEAPRPRSVTPRGRQPPPQSPRRHRDDIEDFTSQIDGELDYTPLVRPEVIPRRRLDAFSPPPDEDTIRFNARSAPDDIPSLPAVAPTSSSNLPPTVLALGDASTETAISAEQGETNKGDSAAIRAAAEEADMVVAASEPEPVAATSVVDAVQVEASKADKLTGDGEVVTSAMMAVDDEREEGETTGSPMPSLLDRLSEVAAVKEEAPPPKPAAPPALAPLSPPPTAAAASKSLLERLNGPLSASTSLIDRMQGLPQKPSLAVQEAARKAPLARRSPPRQRSRSPPSPPIRREPSPVRQLARPPTPTDRTEADHYSPPRQIRRLLSPAPRRPPSPLRRPPSPVRRPVVEKPIRGRPLTPPRRQSPPRGRPLSPGRRPHSPIPLRRPPSPPRRQLSPLRRAPEPPRRPSLDQQRIDQQRERELRERALERERTDRERDLYRPSPRSAAPAPLPYDHGPSMPMQRPRSPPGYGGARSAPLPRESLARREYDVGPPPMPRREYEMGPPPLARREYDAGPPPSRRDYDDRAGPLYGADTYRPSQAPPLPPSGPAYRSQPDHPSYGPPPSQRGPPPSHHDPYYRESEPRSYRDADPHYAPSASYGVHNPAFVPPPPSQGAYNPRFYSPAPPAGPAAAGYGRPPPSGPAYNDRAPPSGPAYNDRAPSSGPAYNDRPSYVPQHGGYSQPPPPQQPSYSRQQPSYSNYAPPPPRR